MRKMNLNYAANIRMKMLYRPFSEEAGSLWFSDRVL